MNCESFPLRKGKEEVLTSDINSSYRCIRDKKLSKIGMTRLMTRHRPGDSYIHHDGVKVIDMSL